MTLRIDEAPTEVLANGTSPADDAARRSLREQAIEAFGILQRRANREIAPERLRDFLKAQPLSTMTLFEPLAEFARAQGLVVVHQDIAPDELLNRNLVDDLVLLPDGDIGVVLEVGTFARSITVQNLGPSVQERYDVDKLARAYPGEIQVLHLQGQAPSFLDDGTHAPPLYSDEDTAVDPHDRLDNARETFESLLRLLGDERSDIITVTMYAVMVALFSLTIPLASQGIIDAVSMGTFTNQIVIFCAAISLGLLLYGIFTMLQYYTVDVLQRRLFAATGLEIAYRIPMMKRSALEGEYGPALMNRFFDVITMQKSLAKMLIDGLAYSLVALVSLLLLGIYSPFFLVIGLLAVLFTPIIVWGLGRNGLETSFMESSTKYAMAHWLEDLSRCHQSFKLNGAPSYVHARTDRIASRYVRTRGAHFRIFGR
ncbi:MAG: ABC transporter ATP-binding protein, partial [Bacteroidota bacterium]